MDMDNSMIHLFRQIGVYKIKCGACDHVYILGRSFKTACNEHLDSKRDLHVNDQILD